MLWCGGSCCLISMSDRQIATLDSACYLDRELSKHGSMWRLSKNSLWTDLFHASDTCSLWEVYSVRTIDVNAKYKITVLYRDTSSSSCDDKYGVDQLRLRGPTNIFWMITSGPIPKLQDEGLLFWGEIEWIQPSDLDFDDKLLKYTFHCQKRAFADYTSYK